MKSEVEEEIMKEIMEEWNWKERIVVRLFKKVILKTYNYTRVNIVNKLL